VPEGDTVWLTAKRLHAALAGRPVTTFDLRVPQLATSDLTGDIVEAVLARGKHILMRFAGGLTLHSHLRMDGSWHIVAAGRRPSAQPGHRIRALIGNAQWLAAGYRVHDLRIVRASDEDQLVGHLGPDLLGPDWDAAEAIRRLNEQPPGRHGTPATAGQPRPPRAVDHRPDRTRSRPLGVRARRRAVPPLPNPDRARDAGRGAIPARHVLVLEMPTGTAMTLIGRVTDSAPSDAVIRRHSSSRSVTRRWQEIRTRSGE